MVINVISRRLPACVERGGSGSPRIHDTRTSEEILGLVKPPDYPRSGRPAFGNRTSDQADARWLAGRAYRGSERESAAGPSLGVLLFN